MLDKNDKFTHLHTTIDDVAKANIGHDDGIKQNPFLEQDVHYDDGNEKRNECVVCESKATLTILLKEFCRYNNNTIESSQADRQH